MLAGKLLCELPDSPDPCFAASSCSPRYPSFLGMHMLDYEKTALQPACRVYQRGFARFAAADERNRALCKVGGMLGALQGCSAVNIDSAQGRLPCRAERECAGDPLLGCWAAGGPLHALNCCQAELWLNVGVHALLAFTLSLLCDDCTATCRWRASSCGAIG